jgi:hypothetical protein
MADISDVEAGMASLVAEVLYPAGTGGSGGYGMGSAGGWDIAAAYGNPTALQVSAAGLPVRIYRGAATAQQLDKDTAAGIAHVTVFQGLGMIRLGAGDLDPDISIPGPAPTIDAAVAGNLVTLTGTATAGNLVGLMVDGLPYVYAVQASDNPASIAAALAGMISAGDITADDGSLLVDDGGNPWTLGDSVAIGSISGGVTMTIGTTAPVIARTGSMGQSIRRTRQQTAVIKLICWAPTPQARDAICSVVDAKLSDLRWMQLADQKAYVKLAGTSSNDLTSKAALWRRDLDYHVTYQTTLITAAPPLLFGQLDLTSAGAAVTIFS